MSLPKPVPFWGRRCQPGKPPAWLALFGGQGEGGMRKILATFDQGWIGKHVKSQKEHEYAEQVIAAPEVSDPEENKPFLYLLEDGVWFGCWKAGKIGFLK